jgi:hypothetical protein
MFSVSILLLLGGTLAIPEPVRTMAFNVVHATAAAGAAAYVESRQPATGTLSGPVGIIPPPQKP